MIPRVCGSSKNGKEEIHLKFILLIEEVKLLAWTDNFFHLFTKLINNILKLALKCLVGFFRSINLAL